MARPEPMARFRNDEDGVEAQIYRYFYSYVVALRDTDADLYLPEKIACGSYAEAYVEARRAAGLDL